MLIYDKQLENLSDLIGHWKILSYFHKSVQFDPKMSAIFKDPGEGLIMMKLSNISLKSPECSLQRTSRLTSVTCKVSEKFTTEDKTP